MSDTTPAPPVPEWEARLLTVEAWIAKAEPIVNEVAGVAASASTQGHSITSLLGAVASKIFGFSL